MEWRSRRVCFALSLFVGVACPQGIGLWRNGIASVVAIRGIGSLSATPCHHLQLKGCQGLVGVDTIVTEPISDRSGDRING